MNPAVLGVVGIVEVELTDGDHPIVLGRTFTLNAQRARALAALLVVAAKQIERDKRQDERDGRRQRERIMRRARGGA